MLGLGPIKHQSGISYWTIVWPKYWNTVTRSDDKALKQKSDLYVALNVEI